MEQLYTCTVEQNLRAAGVDKMDIASSTKLLALLLLTCASYAIVKSQGMSCGEYGIDGEVSECTDGFASLFHIDRVEDIVKVETKDKRQVLIPGINFTCNGTLTKWIFAAEWQGNIDGYTELQIWRKTSTTDNVYTKVGATTIMVTESSSEVYEYPVDPPLAFLEGDVLGYFQPYRDRSQIVVYVEKSDAVTVNTHRIDVGNNDVVSPTGPFDIQSDDTKNETRYPMIAVETDPPDCGCGFMSMERVIALLSPVGMRKDFSNKQLIFPDITFTCSGEVVTLTMVGKWNSQMNRNSYPELQIWRPSGDTTYSKEQSTTIMPTSEEDDRVYEFPVQPPLPFQPGDILGVRQPASGDSRLQVDYEDGGDSVYYQKDIDDSEEFDTTDGDIMTDLPLVTVEIVEYPASSSPVVTATESPVSSSADHVTSSTTTTGATESAQGASSTPSQTPSPSSSEASPSLMTTTDTEDSVVDGASTSQVSQQPSSSASSTSSTGATESAQGTSSTPSQTTSPPSSEPSTMPTVEQQDSGGSGGLQGGAIVGIVFGLIVALLLVGISVAVIVFLTRRQKYSIQSPKETGMNNPTYANNNVEGVNYSKSTDCAVLSSGTYEDVINLYAVPDAPQHYEMADLQDSGQQWGIYVPTTDQRSVYQEVDDIYSYAGLKPVVNEGGADVEEKSFFTESDIYWEPASNPSELYEQLSQSKFREIQRNMIQTVEHLGSGQFGTVDKGVWQGPRGKQEVAIKLLKSGASEEDRVKFLKEAAIMGQFSHRNVISLHGVVTLGEPVMIVMELMQNGDLRESLINMRPTPGEMAPQALYQHLLDFCHQISAGMTYLSDKAFVHRDLAARNILLSGKTCKIADFGMARDLEESAYYTSQGGQIPVKWTAPEALNFKKYSTASDVWSFGCLMYEIWSLGHKPFEAYTNVQTVRMVMTGWRLPPPPGCPRELYSLMILCWHPEAGSRPHFPHLLQCLSRSEHELLSIPEEVRGQATLLGAPLETAKELYTDLQNTHLKK